ncbi:heparin-sulfate lyase HepC [Flavobacterium sp. KACC 22763]|uniref:heparin-sulfate lyase HepC n=1 Tax=Flavobacterium sp. KACC 22763 TaxID=3025668 RepID=UPI0023653DB2|nr:heparin-sulfate lyase HepC [Flavobacterium sp. KACC 22763]WDF65452.1 heparinase II/III family protein [Flavobacterium sp. KACC 22763]
MSLSAKTFALLFVLLLMQKTFAQEVKITKSSFNAINLDYKGLEKVKKLVSSSKYEEAANRLLDYYRNRTDVQHLNFNATDLEKLKGKKVNNNTLELANNILIHKFKPHKGYPAYDYGQDINWQYRPVQDQLLSTFLHRTAFWESLGIVYNSSGDEKYAKEWVFEVRDWIKKNKQDTYPDEKDFAWKAFVVSFRLNHWSSYFNMFLNSPNFTPAFLMEFLNSYNEQAEYVSNNYTDVGNHRLYEALHMMYAGSFFPEMKSAAAWRKSGITVLNEEIQKQILPDGVQFELSPSYHIGTIKIFLDALQIAQLNKIENEFPESYSNLVEKMVLAVGKYSFPDYTFPLYGNSFLTTKSAMLKNYQIWEKAFPKNEIIKYYASNFKSGKKPDYLSSSLPYAGFYAFRNGLDTSATVMQIKAGPPAEFHSHPDNGNFVLWIKGRNFTPDSGSFVYANVGNQENSKRDWYRSTKAHQTLTLDNQNITNDAKLLEWQPDGNTQILSYSNPSYKDLNHERTFLFIDNTFFLIIDRAIGAATGNLGIHYNLKEDSKASSDSLDNSITTHYEDGNNLLIQVVNKEKIALKDESSFVSYEYQKETPRPAFTFEKIKNNQQTQGFITLLLPFDGQKAPTVKITENPEHNISQGKIDLNITINGKERHIKKNLVH